MKLTLFLLLFAAISAPGATVVAPVYLSLPQGAITTGAAADATGNLLVTGTYPVQGQSSAQVFVAKLPVGGGAPLYLTAIAPGCPSCASGQIAVDGAGNAYATGSSSWTSFPTTAGVMEASLNGAQQAGFVVKLNPAGDIVYSTLFGGGTGQQTSPTTMTVSPSGEVFVSGDTIGSSFIITSTANQQTTNPAAFPFLMRISAAADRIIYSIIRGATRIAVDSQNNAYIVQSGGGQAFGENFVTTPGAFQSVNKPTVCSATPVSSFPCPHQYLMKLDPTGENVIFGTFVSGSYSDSPIGIFVDAAGDVYLAGTTGSTDYPVTAGALQTKNLAQAFGDSQPPFFTSVAEANTAYVTKISADGTQLLYSTLLGGSITDIGWGLEVDAQGRAEVALSLQSPDFPGLPSLPQRCLPDRAHAFPALATLSADASALVSLSMVEGVGPSASAPLLAGANLIATDASVGLTYSANSTAAGVPDAIACITDGADFAPAGPVSPGEVVTIFGSLLSAGSPAVYDGTQAHLPLTMEGTSVLVNGAPAPLMYVSPTQINFVMPYEIASGAQATIQVNAPGGVTASRTMPVAGATPSFFGGDDNGYATCDGKAQAAVLFTVTILNADGTFNSCDNPAKAGTTVYLFLNGTGVNNPESTGEIPPAPVPLSPALTLGGQPDGATLGPATSIPGTTMGVWRVALNVPGFLTVESMLGPFTLRVNGAPFRESNIVFWAEP